MNQSSFTCDFFVRGRAGSQAKLCLFFSDFFASSVCARNPPDLLHSRFVSVFYAFLGPCSGVGGREPGGTGGDGSGAPGGVGGGPAEIAVQEEDAGFLLLQVSCVSSEDVGSAAYLSGLDTFGTLQSKPLPAIVLETCVTLNASERQVQYRAPCFRMCQSQSSQRVAGPVFRVFSDQTCRSPSRFSEQQQTGRAYLAWLWYCSIAPFAGQRLSVCLPACLSVCLDPSSSPAPLFQRPLPPLSPPQLLRGGGFLERGVAGSDPGFQGVVRRTTRYSRLYRMSIRSSHIWTSQTLDNIVILIGLDPSVPLVQTSGTTGCSLSSAPSRLYP